MNETTKTTPVEHAAVTDAKTDLLAWLRAQPGQGFTRGHIARVFAVRYYHQDIMTALDSLVGEASIGVALGTWYAVDSAETTPDCAVVDAKVAILEWLRAYQGTGFTRHYIVKVFGIAYFIQDVVNALNSLERDGSVEHRDGAWYALEQAPSVETAPAVEIFEILHDGVSHSSVFYRDELTAREIAELTVIAGTHEVTPGAPGPELEWDEEGNLRFSDTRQPAHFRVVPRHLI